jgi:hypothetical protein
MINFEERTIDVPASAGLNGNQIYLMVDKELVEFVKDGKLPEGKEHPYEMQSVKLGERTGQEPINVGLSSVILQRVQLKQGWSIFDSTLKEQKEGKAE